MQIVHLVASDRQGGAAISAYRLHDGLRRTGLASRMLVGMKITSDSNVLQARPKVFSFSESVRRGLAARLRAFEYEPYLSTRSPRLEIFSDDRVAGRDWLSESLPAADVYHLHWVAGFLDYRRFFARLPAHTPLVWTLHDMNPFTGGCHYSLECNNFVQNCGACPLLGSTNSNDLSARINRRKKQALSHLAAETTRVVAPSKWLQECARNSSLLHRFSIELIPNSLDTDIFSPRHRSMARELFKLPQGNKIVLFVADSISNYRKGLDLLVQAVAGSTGSGAPTLAAIGNNASGASGKGFVELGRLDNERIMSFAYSAADLFVLPTRADNLPNVILESFACGTPVVAFEVGGIPDVVRPGVTGLLVPPENVTVLRTALEDLLRDDVLRARMSLECRKVAVKEYALETQAFKYIAIYQELIETAARLRKKASSFRRTAFATAKIPSTH